MVVERVCCQDWFSCSFFLSFEDWVLVRCAVSSFLWRTDAWGLFREYGVANWPREMCLWCRLHSLKDVSGSFILCLKGKFCNWAVPKKIKPRRFPKKFLKSLTECRYLWNSFWFDRWSLVLRTFLQKIRMNFILDTILLTNLWPLSIYDWFLGRRILWESTKNDSATAWMWEDTL